MNVKAKPLVKICGIRDADILAACDDAGADFVGLVFYPHSVRYVSPDRGQIMLRKRPKNARIVALVVDESMSRLEEIMEKVKPDYIQLHGFETPERAEEVRRTFNVGIIKALGVSDASDIHRAGLYTAADYLLLDAPAGDQPGGNATAFDWNILMNAKLSMPWLLAGGLTPQNVAKAIEKTNPAGVDVSSGVERRRGEKDPELVQAFISAVKAPPPAPV
ncbi:MAG: phosphoribosylanthranilate isomerase [Alphaproteobacteria bacterium]|jgi:phosphoribosylanthranilate isomerase|nr:phosphoribosylanthranilate isomerase [Thalassospira sp.]MCE2964357.1 phosphoribosylanthranilate isomerase [Alphaproteobacteria bacterium]